MARLQGWLERIAHRADAAALGYKQQGPRDLRQNVRMLMGVEVGEGRGRRRWSLCTCARASRADVLGGGAVPAEGGEQAKRRSEGRNG